MIRKALLVSVLGLALGATAALAFPPIDLTTSGATWLSAVDGTYWKQNVTQPTGTGVYDPFNRIRANGIEEGMSSDAGGVYDNLAEAANQNWNHTFFLGNLGVTTTDLGNGTQGYYRFTLDINEPNGGGMELISLDELRIYTLAAGGSRYHATEAAVLGAGGVERYDMDQISDQDVYLNHDLTEGSGHDDMELWIPTSFFAGALGTDIVYFYSKFGATGDAFAANFDSEDGFEEWAADLTSTPPQAAEPSTLTLLGLGLIGVIGAGIRRKK